MTVPIIPGRGSIGTAYIEVHGNTEPFDDDLEKGLNQAAKDAEKDLDKTGTTFGDKIAKSTAKELGKHGKEYSKSIENATKNTTVRVRSRFSFSSIRDAIRRRFRRDIGDGIVDEIGDAFDRAGRSGVFSRLTQGVADAIGAGFNVSGRSPLIAVLLPALAALIGVIVAALQAVNSLVAVLAIIPNLIAAIGLQVGVVAIAFQGVGKAIQGAFAAKNAKELREALKDLTPAARTFVRTLLPLEPFFKRLRTIVQQNFFKALGNIITPLLKALGPSLFKGFGTLATSMGKFFRDLALFFASPNFVKFVNVIFPATARWLAKLGPGLVRFLEGLTRMSIAVMPFLEDFGTILITNLDRFSDLLNRMADNPETQEWLKNMGDTLMRVFTLLFNFGEFLFVFFRELDRAGGQEVIQELIRAMQLLSFFFASPVGQKAMQGLVDLSIIGIKSFTGLLIAVGLVLAAFEVLGEWLRVTFIPGVIDVFRAIGTAAAAFGNWFAQWAARIAGWVFQINVKLGQGVADLWRKMTKTASDFANAIIRKALDLIAWFKSFPGKMLGAIGNLYGLLINAGRNLINGLMDGIRQKIGPLLDLINWIVSQIGRVFPGSPAKEGPLSGQGYTLLRGQRMIKDFIKGIEMEVPDLKNAVMNATSNIVFGTNSIQMTFHGPLPEQGQARTTGAAMGMAAANAIAARNTRLAVRTM